METVPNHLNQTSMAKVKIKIWTSGVIALFKHFSCLSTFYCNDEHKERDYSSQDPPWNSAHC